MYPLATTLSWLLVSWKVYFQLRVRKVEIGMGVLEMRRVGLSQGRQGVTAAQSQGVQA